METPLSAPEPPAATKVGTVETQAEKMTDDDILYLLGLMEGDAKPSPAPVEAPKPEPKPEPKPAPKPEPEPKPEPKPMPKAEPKPAATGDEAGAGLGEPELSADGQAKAKDSLNRLASTEGMRQAILVAGKGIVHSGDAVPAGAEKIVTLVRLLADVTKRASSSMKHGEARQVLMFGTQGMAVVSPSSAGILAVVAGASVKVGLLRLAMNDCQKRLSEVK